MKNKKKTIECDCGNLVTKQYFYQEIKPEQDNNFYYYFKCEECGQMYKEKARETIELDNYEE